MDRMKLEEIIYNLKQSGTTSDFPYLLGIELHKIVIDNFKSVNSNWSLWTHQTDLADFKSHYRVMLSEAEDLLEMVEGESVKDSKLSEARYSILCKTYERAFSFTRKMIKNDDADTLRKIPALLGRAGGRKIPTYAVALLEGNGKAYDGTEFFYARTLTNVANTALTANLAGANAVIAGINAIKDQDDIGGITKLGLNPKYLMVHPVLTPVAKVICNSPTIDNGSSVLVMNPAYGLLTPLEEPFLTSKTGWYVLVDPLDYPQGIEVGFLDNIQEPQTFRLASDTESIIGIGANEGDFHTNSYKYKVRLEFGIARGDYRGWYRGKA